MSGKTQRVVNRAAQALRLAAATLRSSKSALGAYFRRLCSRIDKPKAVTAAAHKLPRARAAGTGAACGQARHGDGPGRTTGMKRSLRVSARGGVS
jgi:hypothetical protein